MKNITFVLVIESGISRVFSHVLGTGGLGLTLWRSLLTAWANESLDRMPWTTTGVSDASMVLLTSPRIRLGVTDGFSEALMMAAISVALAILHTRLLAWSCFGSFWRRLVEGREIALPLHPFLNFWHRQNSVPFLIFSKLYSYFWSSINVLFFFWFTL